MSKEKIEKEQKEKRKQEKVERKKQKKAEHQKSRKQKKIRWEKLDNTAQIFPVIAGENMTNVYRISVTLNEEVQPKLLQQALDLVLPKIDGFNLRMRTGVFWYNFEENGKPAPKVTEEHLFPCRYIHSASCVANAKDCESVEALTKYMLNGICDGSIK